MISKEEWRATAEHAAAAKYGEKYAGWLAFRRFLAGPLGIVALVAVVAGGAVLAWKRVVSPALHGAGHFGNVPIGFWYVAGVSLLVTVFLFRPRLIAVSPMYATFRGLIVGFLWLGLGAYLLSCLA